MFMSDLIPGMHNYVPMLASGDAVPFRFTPNMQNFLGPICTEGILTSSLMAFGRCLTDPEFDLDQHLCLFGRDEVTHWFQIRGKSSLFDLSFRKSVINCIENIVSRAEQMACKIEREQAVNNPSNPGDKPVVQTVTNLISQATNPIYLTRMGDTFFPLF
jgi:transformation/transcription domain-associated protein